MPSSIVIGAGWAGLMCAYTLIQRGHQVTLIEAAPQLGGRARSIGFSSYTVDNGQHVCLGAYHTLRNLLSELELDENNLFKIIPMQLLILGQRDIRFRFPNLPPPFQILFGLIFAKNMPLKAKFEALRLCKHLKKINFGVTHDLPLLQFLKNYHQSEFLIKHLWEPIAVATMTTPINIASTQVFLNILERSFNRLRTDSNWYIPNTDLSAILPNHIEKKLLSSACRIIKSQAIKSIQISSDRCIGVSSKDKEWSADHFIFATPPWTTAALFAPHHQLQDVYTKLKDISTQPIITIYYEFSKPVNLPYPIIGMLETMCQWVFDRASAGQPNILSAIISGPGQHQKLSHDQLADVVLNEIRFKFPHLQLPVKSKVINDKKSAFSCDFSIQGLRPQLNTQIGNLWLTGDYIQTGLPSTLESALLSGKQTGEMI